jgi:hypothetical protein
MSETYEADAKFRVFENAAKAGLLVRIHYMQTVPKDPALPEHIREQGIRTIMDGYPVALSKTELSISQAGAQGLEPADLAALRKVVPLRTIPRDRVLSVNLIGETTASLPKTDEDWKPPEAA